MNTKHLGFGTETVGLTVQNTRRDHIRRGIAILTFCLICIDSGQAQQQISNSAAVSTAETSPYHITARGPHQNIWTQVAVQTNWDGRLFVRTNSYTELATGLNHEFNGQWVASSEDITITPDGNGAGTNTQHQVYFAADINTTGSIELITPSGQEMHSTVLGLSLYDAASGSNAIIANLQNSIGQVLQTSNQVIYTNALVSSEADFEVDVLYTHRKKGFEQDIVLHQQPPTPQSYGLNPATTLLQVWTEFYDTADPVVSTNAIMVATNESQRLDWLLSDETLDFGSLTFQRGKAFLKGITNTYAPPNGGVLVVPISKHWIHQNGRKFLMEEVPYASIFPQLSTLPPSSASLNTRKPSNSLQTFFPVPHSASKKSTIQSNTQRMQCAKADLNRQPGFVLDYVTINSSISNYTFQSDTTYLVTGDTSVNGTTILEGGTVVKYYDPDGPELDVYGPIVCQTGPYRPAIFTSANDNSVGAEISGSTGNPTLQYNTFCMVLFSSASNSTMSNLRFSFAFLGLASEINGTAVDLWDCQFVNCYDALENDTTNALGLHNTLFAKCTNIFYFSYSPPFAGEQITVDAIQLWDNHGSTPAALNFTNSIILSSLESGAPFNLNSTVTNPVASPFQTNGAANYYLAASSSCRNVGTSNITPAALADIQGKTTWPPLLMTNVFTQNTVLSPVVQRDINSSPDLGYHYAPIDYMCSNAFVIGATLTLTNGVALSYIVTGISLTNSASLISQGSPTQPNIIAFYSQVQEQATNLFTTFTDPYAFQVIQPILSWGTNAVGANAISLRFTDLVIPNGTGIGFDMGDGLPDYPAVGALTSLIMRDCEMYGGGSTFTANFSTLLPSLYIENNLFQRFEKVNFGSLPGTTFYNNTVVGAVNGMFIYKVGAGASPNIAKDNAFDDCQVYLDGSFSNNAYLNNTTLNMTAEANAIQTNITWITGPLGFYYQQTNSPLINEGYTTADQLGLYHYTTQTNEVPETNSVADIGYHYVVLGANDLPLNSNGNSPDYLADANGNGLVDSGEIAWNEFGDLGLNVIITRPANNSIIP